jgi:hypothetical protein
LISRWRSRPPPPTGGVSEEQAAQPPAHGASIEIEKAREYADNVTHEQAILEVQRQRASHPEATWIATERDGTWSVARIGLAPAKATGTATKPPPAAPRDDPHSAVERAAWFAAGG